MCNGNPYQNQPVLLADKKTCRFYSVPGFLGHHEVLCGKFQDSCSIKITNVKLSKPNCLDVGRLSILFPSHIASNVNSSFIRLNFI